MALPATHAIIGLIFVLMIIPVAPTEVASCNLTSGYYTLTSSYQTNMEDLWTFIPSYASSNPSLFAAGSSGKAPDTIYTRAWCRGDGNGSSCFSCVSSAIRKAQEKCPFKKEVIVYSDDCVLSFSNENYEIQWVYVKKSHQNVSAALAPKFFAAVIQLLNATAEYAANKDPVKFFGTGEAAFNEKYPKIYALAQCPADMNTQGCSRCLWDQITGYMDDMFFGLQGGIVLGIYCRFQFETYPFFKGRPTVQLQSLPPSSASQPVEGSKKSFWRKKTTVIAVILSILLVCLLFAFYLGCKKHICKRKSEGTTRIESFLHKNEAIIPKRYTYTEVKNMTRQFAEKLGQGAFGAVYRGRFRDNREIAVKLLKDQNTEGEDFMNEVNSISRTSHVNIVSLLGFCLEGKNRALIYDYMPNGSLEKYAFKGNSEGGNKLGWVKLFDIAVGIARGLEYLHRGCNTQIVHFDIKPHNILLDQNFCPKISDFGLAKLCLNQGSEISNCGARGTCGFMSPEITNSRLAVSSKSDVYSYGMMILMMTGVAHTNVGDNDESVYDYFPGWIFDHVQEYAATVSEKNGEIAELVRRLIVVGLHCIQYIAAERPTMTKVVEMLEGSTSVLELPPKEFVMRCMSEMKDTSTVGNWESMEESGDNSMPSAQQQEQIIKNKFRGLIPKKPPLILKDHERAYFDSADWALGKYGQQGVSKPKGPLEALRTKLQPTRQHQQRPRRSIYAASENEMEMALTQRNMNIN